MDYGRYVFLQKHDSLVPYSLFSCFLQKNNLRKALIPFIGVRKIDPPVATDYRFDHNRCSRQ